VPSNQGHHWRRSRRHFQYRLTVTLQYIMSNFNITAPDRLPYALEPALRSIRQLIAFQEITLRDSSN
jgi:hypothetical protein